GRAAAIVEELRRDRPRAAPEPATHLLEEVRFVDGVVVEADGGRAHASAARRMPLNCQRAAGGKKLRYVGRRCESGVAHEPPRSTYWLHMNLPLYSPSVPGSGR